MIRRIGHSDAVVLDVCCVASHRPRDRRPLTLQQPQGRLVDRRESPVTHRLIRLTSHQGWQGNYVGELCVTTKRIHNSQSNRRLHIISQFQRSPGEWSDEATPGPIPNPAVKLVSADGTWGVAPWESRSLPTSSCPYHRTARFGAPFFVAAAPTKASHCCPGPSSVNLHLQYQKY